MSKFDNVNVEKTEDTVKIGADQVVEALDTYGDIIVATLGLLVQRPETSKCMLEMIKVVK